MRRGNGLRNSILQGLWVVMAVPQTRPSIEIFGFHMVESQGQKRNMEIEATKARIFKVENLVALDTVRSLVWGKDPKPFEVTGEFAVINSATQDLEIYQKSRVRSPDGFLFKTNSVLYQAADRTITTDEPVEANQVASATESDSHLTGKGLTINLNQNTYEIRKNVRTEQKLAAAKTLNVTANNLIIYPDKNSATFSHKVLVKSPDFNLKGDRLIINFERKDETSPLTARELIMDSPERSKRIEASLKNLTVHSRGLSIELDPVQGSLKKSEAIGEAEAETDDGTSMRADRLVMDSDNGHNRILLRGHVAIQTENRKGSCEEATFYPDTGDIVLNRIASVTNDKQKLEGERIRFSTKKSDITVEKAKGSMDRKDLGGR